MKKVIINLAAIWSNRRMPHETHKKPTTIAGLIILAIAVGGLVFITLK